jgi:outer membrane immunogenic protein
MNMVRRFVLGAIISLVWVEAAGAADLLPTPKSAPPPPSPAAYTWTGFSAGLNAGYGWGSGGAKLQTSGTATGLFVDVIGSGSIPTSVSFNRSGFIGGGQIGYNYQIRSMVLGVEADLDGAHVGGSSTSRTAPARFAPAVISADSTLNWLGTARARLGFTPVDRWLVYATGGLAYGADQHRYLANQSAFDNSFASSRIVVSVGWILGAGLEWAFADNWSVKAEYLHYYLGSSSDATTPSAKFAPLFVDGKVSNKFTDSGDIARLGVNYKFF